MDDFEILLNMHKKKQENIEKISNALINTSKKAENLDTKLPNGSTQQVTLYQNNGKTVFTTSVDNKNVMTFSTRKQLLDYLEE